MAEPFLADERTLSALDFAAVRDRVAAGTRTERGRSLAAALHPLTHFAAVRRAQEATAEVRALAESVDFHVRRAADTQALTEAAALGRGLSPQDLRIVAEAAASAAAAVKATRARASGAIAAITAPYAPVHDVVRAIVDAVDERDTVLDRASPALGRIRRAVAAAQADARGRAGTIARSGHRAVQDHVVTVREGRFVVPIKAEFAGEFAGIVHDTSSSGQTVFVEPLAALDANNRVRTLRLEEEREVARILDALSRLVGNRAAQIEANVDVLAQLDLLAAKGSLARAMDAHPPELLEDASARIVRGRHPLLGERAVPQTFAIDEATRVLVISGPNMGGKTVTLKMLGLFLTMTYAGMQLPAAEGTQIGRFDRLVADIGDEQSIAENTSTFSAHLRRMREILEHADERTLVLIDEIGGGTEPASGAALAVAFLERLLAVGVRAVVTTHATGLKLFAHAAALVANASVRFDPHTFAPTYHLDVGAPGQSLAFPLARSLGIEELLVLRAQALLESRERDYESALAELATRSAELQAERDNAAAVHRSAVERERALADEQAALADERRTLAERAEERLREALRDFAKQLHERVNEQGARQRVTAADGALMERTLEAMRRDLGITVDEQSAETSGPLLPGDRVRVLSLRQNGEVVENYGDGLLIAIGALKTVVKKGDLLRIPGERSRERAAGGGGAKLEVAARAAMELDVRGKRFIDAQPLVERWIDDAALAGVSSLRLIHGKGTGQLGRGLQEYLRTNPAVSSVRYGNADEGSGGVSVVELRG